MKKKTKKIIFNYIVLTPKGLVKIYLYLWFKNMSRIKTTDQIIYLQSISHYLSSALTMISPVTGCKTNRVALSPLRACSILFFHWVNQRLSKVTRAVANLLYTLTWRLVERGNKFYTIMNLNLCYLKKIQHAACTMYSG